MPGNRTRSQITASLIVGALYCGHALASADPIDEDGGLSAYTGSPRSSYSIRADRPQITTSFRSFTGETLRVGFSLEQGAGRASWREFGIDRRELDMLQQNCIDSGRCNQSEMNRLTFDYYYRHGLRTRQVAGRGLRLYVDVPQVARRNQPRVQPLAAALQRLAAEKGGDERWLVDAAVALVQTGLEYRQPAAVRHQGGAAGRNPAESRSAANDRGACTAALPARHCRHAAAGPGLPAP
jgi:hypothetical protein